MKATYIATAQQLWQKYLRLFFSIRKRVIAAVIVAIIILFGLFRACSTNNMWGNHHVFRIGRDPTWYPLQLYDKERNMLAFTNELLIAIAKEQNFQFQLFVASPGTLIEGLNKGVYDGILSALAPTAITKEDYLFSDPIYLLGPVLIVPESSNIRNVQDLNGKIVGIRVGTSLIFDVDRFPNINVHPYDNIQAALVDLEKNNIDAVIIEALPAYVYTSGPFARKLKVVTAPLTNVGIRLITKYHSDAEKFMDHFNAGLKAVKANGTYAELINKWGLFDTSERSKDPKE